MFGRTIQIRFVKAERPSGATSETKTANNDDVIDLIDYAARTILQGVGIIIAMQTVSKIMVNKLS